MATNTGVFTIKDWAFIGTTAKIYITRFGGQENVTNSIFDSEDSPCQLIPQLQSATFCQSESTVIIEKTPQTFLKRESRKSAYDSLF